MSKVTRDRQLIVVGIAAVAVATSLLIWSRSKKKKRAEPSSPLGSPPRKPKKERGADSDPTPRRTNRSPETVETIKTVDETLEPEVKTAEIHNRIEELDKKGKVFFKNKQFMEAAQAFTEAMDYLKSHTIPDNATKSSMVRQQITLLNNRSAMYERADAKELSLEDCDRILELDVEHSKARSRKLRLLEALERYREALREICAMQLLYMKANRINMRMGLPVPPPPVPQKKMEEMLTCSIPEETQRYLAKLKALKGTRQLPGNYTILQLLKSYTDYNAWMALAAKGGPVDELTAELAETKAPAERASLLLKRGRRHVYNRKYEEATNDMEEGFALVDGLHEVIDAMPHDSYARLLEWTGMVRHWHYNLESALELVKKCAELEPANSLLVVKQAGIQLDMGNVGESLKLFDNALSIDPKTTDALLHRANLLMIQGKSQEAKVDLEKCIELRPNCVQARLRLASILVASEKMGEAERQLQLAEETDPNSSEVHSYRGEIYFAKDQMEDARREFEKAIALDPTNPTPYVNAAVAYMQSAQRTQTPDPAPMVSLLESAIDADPQFTAAYVHMGQLKLGISQDLVAAKEVVELYDRGLENARSPDEIKELVAMRLMALAQIDAATMLKMETFGTQ